MGKTKTAFIGEENQEDKKKNKPEKKDKVHVSGLKGGQRIKVVGEEEAQIPEQETREDKEASQKKESKGTKQVHKRGKKYVSAKAKIDPLRLYPTSEAIKLVKETSYSKFDGTIELHLVIKKTGTSVSVTLPHPFGKEKKIEVASDDTIKALQGGKVSFDVLLATPEMMPKLVPFARILGPRGMMPNAKNGTIIQNASQAKNFSTSSATLKTEKEAPLIHTVIGKTNQTDEQISQNLETVFKAFGGSKQIIKAYIKSTMSPSIKLVI